MDLELKGALAVVTGAGRGIGLAVTTALIDEGARVVAGSRTVTDGLRELAESGRLHPVAVDLATPEGASALAVAAAEHGSVDILVNNVGAVRPRLAGFLSITDEDWLATVNLDLMAAVRATRAVLPGMLAAGRGSIVTISSVNAMLPDPTVMDYSAAKAALTNFCKALSKEVGPAGVRVNTISPGPVATDLWLGDHGVANTIAASSGGDPAAVADTVAAQSVTGRFTSPGEIADLVLYLASPRSANITGADHIIDGGMITTT